MKKFWSLMLLFITSVKGQSCDPPCMNSATCVADDICHCVPTYFGSDCSERQCDGSFCLNGGTCIIDFSNLICRCPTGTDGTTCQFSEIFFGTTPPTPIPAPPVGSPRQFRVVAGPSTGAIALWSTVDPLQINGEIILYELRYSPLNGGEGGLEMSANTTGLIVRPDDLKGDTEYRFRLRAYNRGGPGPYTSTRTIRTLEGVPSLPPLDLRNVSVSSTEIQLRWEHVPPEARNGILTQYEVRYESLNESNEPIPPGIMNKNVTPTTTNTTLTNLEEYVTYNISIRAYTGAGPSGYSNSINVMTLEDVPGVVSNVTWRPGFTYIILFWRKPEDPNGIITSYEITYRINGSDVLTNSTSSTVTNLTIESLTPNTMLIDVTFRGLTNIGLGLPLIVPVISNLPPLVVTNISVALLSPTSIRLSWNRIREPQIRVIDHVVYYREIGAGVDTEQSLNTSFTESSLEIGELIPERSYQFQVKVSADVDGEFFVGERSGFGRALRYRVSNITWLSSFTSITFYWIEPEDSTGIIVGYEIMYRVNNSINPTTSTLETNTVMSLSPNTQLSDISVRALTQYGRGEAYSIQDIIITLPLLIVSNIQVIEVSATAVKVQWDILVHPRIEVTSHIIYYSGRDLSVREQDEERSFIVSGSVSSVMIEKLDGNNNYFEVVIIAEVDGSLVIGPRFAGPVHDGLSTSSIVAQSVAGGVLGFIIVAIVVGVLGVMLVFLWIKHKHLRPNKVEDENFSAPRIQGFPTSPIHATFGQGLKIKVKTIGCPEPTLQWHHGHNVVLPTTSTVKILSDGSLSISSVEHEHKGLYTLTATNYKGKAKGKINLVVEKESHASNLGANVEEKKETLFYSVTVSGGIITEKCESPDEVKVDGDSGGGGGGSGSGGSGGSGDSGDSGGSGGAGCGDSSVFPEMIAGARMERARASVSVLNQDVECGGMPTDNMDSGDEMEDEEVITEGKDHKEQVKEAIRKYSSVVFKENVIKGVAFTHEIERLLDEVSTSVATKSLNVPKTPLNPYGSNDSVVSGQFDSPDRSRPSLASQSRPRSRSRSASSSKSREGSIALERGSSATSLQFNSQMEARSESIADIETGKQDVIAAEAGKQHDVVTIEGGMHGFIADKQPSTGSANLLWKKSKGDLKSKAVERNKRRSIIKSVKAETNKKVYVIPPIKATEKNQPTGEKKASGGDKLAPIPPMLKDGDAGHGDGGGSGSGGSSTAGGSQQEFSSSGNVSQEKIRDDVNAKMNFLNEFIKDKGGSEDGSVGEISKPPLHTSRLPKKASPRYSVPVAVNRPGNVHAKPVMVTSQYKSKIK